MEYRNEKIIDSEKDFYLQKIETLENKCEELKKEIINKNEKIKELRFSVSDLTNRLCYLNAGKSFRIVDLEQALDEIAEIVSGRYEELDPLAKQQIFNIIKKAKENK